MGAEYLNYEAIKVCEAEQVRDLQRVKVPFWQGRSTIR